MERRDLRFVWKALLVVVLVLEHVLYREGGTCAVVVVKLRKVIRTNRETMFKVLEAMVVFNGFINLSAYYHNVDN